MALYVECCVDDRRDEFKIVMMKVFDIVRAVVVTHYWRTPEQEKEYL